MKKLAIFAIIGLLLFGITGVASAQVQDDGCQYCCKVVITGCTFSCGGFYIPGAFVDLYGPLRDCAVDGVVCTESNPMGQYGLWVKVPLGNHWGNTVAAVAWFNWGGYNEVYYEGVTAGFNVDCAVIGQYVMLTKDIPMWAY